MSKGPISYPIPFWVVGPLAILSGCAAMLIVLLRLEDFALLHGFGVDTQTTALAFFLAGFGLGAVLLGLRGDRSRRPLRGFAVLQFALGGFAAAAPALLGALGGASAQPPSSTLHAATLLLLPGVLAGGSLTALVRSGAHTTERAALVLGGTVGLSALGAAIAFPLLASGAWLALALASLAGVLAFALAVIAGPREVFASDGDHIRVGWTGDAGLPVLFGLLVVGAILPLQRFGWNRLLPFALDRADPAGTGFLLHMAGIGVGALLGTALVSGGHNARRLLARALLGAAVLTGAPLFYGDRLLAGGGFGAAAVLVGPGAVAGGVLLPLIAHVTFSDRESIARQAGSMLGLFAAGWAISLALFVPALLDALSSTDMVVTASVALLAGGTVIGFGKGLREWIPAGSATLLVVLVVIGGTQTDALARRMAVVRNPDMRRRVVEERQSALATYAVVENLRNGTRRLYRNGLTGAPGDHYDDGYRMVGHLPALLHPGAKRALVVRFGTGSVAGALVQHPHVEEVHAVARDEAVFELAPAFARQNGDVAQSGKLTRHVGELRPFLRAHPRAYDVVTLEPEAPDSVRGRLQYTSEFYRNVHQALRANGLFSQRLPTEAYGPDRLRRIVRAAGEHFRFVTLWDFADGLVLLAGDEAPKLEAQPLILRFSKVGLDLQRARVGDATHLLASCVGAGEEFAAGGVEPLRDADAAAHGSIQSVDGERHSLALRAELGAKGPGAWATGVSEGVEEAAARGRELRALLAEDGVSSDKLFELADADRGDLRARAAAEERLYAERLERREFGAAARLTLVRDRTAALQGLVTALEGDRRDYYSILLLREGVAVPASELDRLAGQLEGAERVYVENRARMLRNEPPAADEERLPDVTLRDPSAALDAWDEDELRELVLDSECGKRTQEFDAVVLDWFEKSVDQRRAVLLLHRVGWGQSLRVARKLAGRQLRDDLVALAQIFAAAFPEDRTWTRLCGSPDAAVRAAAAEAARAEGGRAHVPELIRLCEDAEVSVRTGAYHSLEGIFGEAMQATGYDPEDPKPEAIAKLADLR